LGKFSFAKTEDFDLWEKIVDLSINSTIFSTPSYLSSLGIEFNLYLVRKGQQVKAAIPLILNSSKDECLIDDLCITTPFIL
jgi:hypothetical protein